MSFLRLDILSLNFGMRSRSLRSHSLGQSHVCRGSKNDSSFRNALSFRWKNNFNIKRKIYSSLRCGNWDGVNGAIFCHFTISLQISFHRVFSTFIILLLLYFYYFLLYVSISYGSSERYMLFIFLLYSLKNFITFILTI